MQKYLNLDLNKHLKDITELFGAEELKIHVNVVNQQAMQAIEEHAKVRH
jgi:hypothetical protein